MSFIKRQFVIQAVSIFIKICIVHSVPADYCLSPLNMSDCHLPPTPVFHYYKPGSRCEIATWRGCPTENKFEDEYVCTHYCIAKIWSDNLEGALKIDAKKTNLTTEAPNWKEDIQTLKIDEMEHLDELLDNVLSDNTPVDNNFTKLKNIIKDDIESGIIVSKVEKETTVTILPTTKDVTSSWSYEEYTEIDPSFNATVQETTAQQTEETTVQETTVQETTEPETTVEDTTVPHTTEQETTTSTVVTKMSTNMGEAVVITDD